MAKWLANECKGCGCEQHCCRQADAAVLLLQTGLSNGRQQAAGATQQREDLRGSCRQTRAAPVAVVGIAEGRCRERAGAAALLLWKLAGMCCTAVA